MSINASQIGVYVEDSPLNTSHPDVSATIEGNTSITTGGVGTGIFVSGTNASATIIGNTDSIYGNTIGINVQGGSATIGGSATTPATISTTNDRDRVHRRRLR